LQGQSIWADLNYHTKVKRHVLNDSRINKWTVKSRGQTVYYTLISMETNRIPLTLLESCEQDVEFCPNNL